jgi:hypothetical protein
MQEQQYGYDGYSPYYGDDRKETSLVSQTNPKEVLFEIEMKLRGKKEVVNEETGKKEWVMPLNCKPLVNDKGINSFLSDAAAVINQNTILSNLKDTEVAGIITSLGDTIINKITMNWKDFDIDKSNLDTVHNSIIIPAFMSLKRAMNEGEKRFLKTSVRAVESYTTNQKPDHNQTSSDKIKFWRD